MNCINPQLIKPIADKYGVSEKDITTATYLYMKKNNVDTYDENNAEYVNFINDYFNINTTVNFSNETQFEKANSIYEKSKDGVFQIDGDPNVIISTLNDAFGAKNVSFFYDNENTPKVRIAQPLFIKDNFSRENGNIKYSSQILLTSYQKQALMSKVQATLDGYVNKIKVNLPLSTNTERAKALGAVHSNLRRCGLSATVRKKANKKFGDTYTITDIKIDEYKTLVDGAERGFPFALAYFNAQKASLIDIPSIESKQYTDSEDLYSILASENDKLLSTTTSELKTLFNNQTQVTVKEVLSNIIKTNPKFKLLAENILSKIGELGDVRLYLTDNMIENAGLATSNNIIYISNNLTDDFAAQTILHEILHTIVLNTKKSNEHVQEVYDIFNTAKKKIFKKYHVNSLEEIKDDTLRRNLYGLTDPDEFVSEFFVNSNFKAELQSIKTDNILQRFINWIKKIVNENIKNQAAETLYNLFKDFDGNILLIGDRKFLSNTKVKKSEFENTKEQQEIKPLTVKQKLDNIISYCQKHFEFNPNKHEYNVIRNGKIISTANKTASGFKIINGAITYVGDASKGEAFEKTWKIPSTTLGTTVDTMVRDFFNGELKQQYSNLTNSQYENLLNDLNMLKKWADLNGIILISADFPMIVKYNGELIGGAMDLIGYKDNGEIFIFDLKNKRSEKNASALNTEYKAQQNIYREMFNAIAEQIGVDLKISENNMKIIEFKCWYPQTDTWTKDSNDNLYFVDESGKTTKLSDSPDYQSPRLLFDLENVNTPKELAINPFNIIMQAINEEGLTNEEVEALFGITDAAKIQDEINSEVSESNSNTVTISEENQQINNLYTSGIKIKDLNNIANNVVNMISDIYDCIQNGDFDTYCQILKIEKSDEDSPEYKQFKKLIALNREDIIKAIPLSMIIDYIKESKFAQFLDYTNEEIEEYDDRSQYIIRTMQSCYANFNGLLTLGNSRLILLEKMTFSKNQQTKEDIIDDGEQNTENENKIDIENMPNKDTEAWMVEQLAVKASLSTEWKRIISKMYQFDENGEPKVDEFGFVEYLNTDTIINNLLNWFKGCTTIEQMTNILEQKIKYKPEYQQILDKINNNEQLKSMFFQNFRKDFNTYSIVMINYKNGKITTSKKIINTCTPIEFMLNTLETKFAYGFEFVNKLFEYNGQSRKVKTEYIKELEKRISNLYDIFDNTDNFLNADYINALENLLAEFGIKFPETTITQTLETEAVNHKVSTGLTENFVQSILNQLQESLNKIKNVNKFNPKYYNYSIFKEQPNEHEISIRENYSKILEKFSPYLEDVIEASSYENGKMHYAFNPPSYTGKMMINFKNAIDNPALFDEYLENEFGQYEWFKINDTYLCPILNMMNKTDGINYTTLAKNAREWFEHKTQLSYNKTPYTELSAISYLHSILAEFFIDSTKGDVKRAFYRIPIMSNKPASEFISMPRFNGKNYKDQLSEYYYNVFLQELMRIRTVLERAVNESSEEIKNYDLSSKWIEKNSEVYAKLKNKQQLSWGDLQTMKDSGASFKFLSFLNDTLNSELKQSILDYLNNKSYIQDTNFIASMKSEFQTELMDSMDKLVDNQIEYFESIGMFETTEIEEKKDGKKVKNTVYKYFDFLNLPENLTTEQQKDEIEKAIANFVWNDMLASINIIELTATDLAYYKNMEDFQKRFAQIHAPGLRLNTYAKAFINGELIKVSDGYSRTMTLKDYEINTGIEDDVTTAFEILSAKHPERADTLNVMKSVVANALKKINIADAQAFTSPTGMMKKLVMAGKWDNNLTEAYNRICSGNFDLNDLNILIQPLKPFVYSQIQKNSYAQTMSKLKVGIQNKNSEYMILLADAILRGSQQNNKLTALFDFMESSAYTGRIIYRNNKIYKDNRVLNDEEVNSILPDYNLTQDDLKHLKNGTVIDKGIYNGRGIDTIQFESAVKVGLEGVLDINNMSYDQIIDTLNTHAKSIINPKEYNDKYVHTFNYEDYAVQQEVPAHLQNHSQLLGSQERILAISDMPFNTFVYFQQYDGKELKTAGDVINRYQHLIAENINESFNELAKELDLNNTNRKERNKKLSELLTDEIKKDARYGADLHRACMLDENGEFNIPLNDPIQSVRIQQLLHSIIKKRINKQKIKGGPVVQATCWGIDKKYKIRFKSKNSKMLKTFKEYGKSKEEYAQYLKTNDATLDSFECAMPVPDAELEKDLIELAKQIDGDEYNGRLATPKEAIEYDLMSEEQLQAIGYRIPTEDKYSIYPMRIVEWVPRAAGEVIILPEEITKLTGSDFDIDKTYIILKEFQKIEKRKIKKSAIEDETDLTSLLQKKLKSQLGIDVDNSETKELLNLWNNNKVPKTINGKEIQDIKGELIFSLITSIVQNPAFNKGKLLPKYKKITENNKQGRNNEIFDIQWTMLTHQDTMDKMFNPGSFDPQKKIAYVIQCLKNKNNKLSYAELNEMTLDEVSDYLKSITSNDNNILKISTQIQFHQQNMVAGKLIGIFANNNVSHAFLQMQNIQMDFNPDLNLNLVGIDFTTGMKVDDIFALDKQNYISKNIAGFLAASVDAVKDPILNHLNLNTYTSNTAMLLARLGLSVEQISLFMSQPILIKFSNLMANKNNEGFASVESVLENMMEEIDPNFKEHLENNAVELTENALVGNLYSENNSFTNFEILRTFYHLQKYSQALNNLTFITKFNSMSNAAGPTIADNIIIEDRLERFNNLKDNLDPIFNDDTFDVLKNSEMLNAFYQNTIGENGAVKKIFSPWFIEYSPKFKEVLTVWKNTTKAPLDEKTINQLVLEFILYKLTAGENPIVNGSTNTRDYYINKFPKEFWKTLNDNPELKDNKLISIISPKIANEKCPVETLNATTGGFSSDVQEEIKIAWTELLESDNKIYNKLGKDLFYYCLMRNGFGFSPKTFIHLASVDVKQNIGYTSILQDLNFNNEYINVADFILQFKRNHSNNYRAVPKFKSSEHPNINKGSNQLIVNENDFNEFVVDSKKPINVIKVDNDIYQIDYVNSEEKVLQYHLISTLGNNNNFLEYDANDPIIKTVINNNNQNLDGAVENETPEQTNQPLTSNQSQTETMPSSTNNMSTPNNNDLISRALQGAQKANGILSNVGVPQGLQNMADNIKTNNNLCK